MSGQAEQLRQTMAFFKLADAAAPAKAPAAGQRAPRRARPARESASRLNPLAMGGALAFAGADVADESQFTKF